MIQVRHGVFETNSSSTHSMTMCMLSEFEEWQKGNVYFNNYWFSSNSRFADKTFVTKEEAIDIIEKARYGGGYDHNFDALLHDEVDDYLAKEYGFYTYDNYGTYTDLEYFEDEITTPHGDTVVAFGVFGYN